MWENLRTPELREQMNPKAERIAAQIVQAVKAALLQEVPNSIVGSKQSLKFLATRMRNKRRSVSGVTIVVNCRRRRPPTASCPKTRTSVFSCGFSVDQQLQTGFFDAPNEPFREGIQIWRTSRKSQRLHSGALHYGPELLREHGGPIMDQKSTPAQKSF